MIIDKGAFISNLELTKAYCHLQVNGNEKDNARIFRSYNPIINGKSLFSFKTEYFQSDIEPNVNYCTSTKWVVDPTEKISAVNDLFDEQINFKRQSIWNSGLEKDYTGRILVSQIDCTVVDGASEAQSLGLVDGYDIPPIDTWFYITDTKESRLLFAWIPSDFIHYANEAVLVNCVECLEWLGDDFSRSCRGIIASI